VHIKNHNSSIIRIVLNRNHEIQYTSIDSQKAIEYIHKLGILNRLSNNFPVLYDLEEYNITIDEISLFNDTYYLITIVRMLQCSDCKKALTDAATGLYNRNYWERIVKSPDYDYKTKNFSLIFIDVDNLKEINDTYGHIIGDKVIETVGQAIKNCIRKEDSGLRYGGDEFIVLLFNRDKKLAYKVVKRIRSEINRLATDLGIEIQISAGAAYYDTFRNMAEIISIADRNLYEEKRIKHMKAKRR